MVSRTVPADQQALAAQKSKIAAFAAWAGVYLVLATINGGLALVAKRGWPYSRSSFEGALAIVFLCELFFSVFLLFYISEPGPESRPSPPPIPGAKMDVCLRGRHAGPGGGHPDRALPRLRPEPRRLELLGLRLVLAGLRGGVCVRPPRGGGG
ncbi:hypothetical protein PG991_011889 [Apiospora marii]|uniref:Uncharacterized protein n=1 Tax=Apiospora marii TaxID=335849 RepID=A0ABR1RFG1_9PEZI